MAKKLLKIMCLAIAIIMMSSIFASCSLFQINEERYRAEVAFEVGDVKVKVGDFVDYYSNTMKQYIDSGYDVQTVWDSLGDQFLLNYVVLNHIKGDASWQGVAQNPYGDLAQEYENAQYLLNEGDMELLLKNVRLALYQSIDNLVVTELGNTYTFAEEETEEDRPLNVLEEGVDFTIGAGALSAADFKTDVDEIDEYLGKFEQIDLSSFEDMVNAYLLDVNADGLTEILADLNKRV